MKLIEIKVKDFKSFSGYHEFEFGNKNGLFLVKGDNGSGKTSFFIDALLWCFFGKSSKNLKGKNINKWGNERSKCVVSVTFLLGNDHFKVIRSRNPNSLSFSINSKASMEIYQKDVNNYIGIDYNGFCNSFVFDQTSTKFLDNPPSERLRIISDLLNLDKWDSCVNISRDRLSAISESLGALDRVIFVKKEFLQAAEKNLLELKNAKKEWMENRKSDGNKGIDILDEERNAIKKKIASLSGKYVVLNSSVVSIEHHLDALSLELEDFEKVSDDNAHFSSVLETTINNLDHEVRALVKLNDDARCPLCRQRVSGIELKRVTKTVFDELDYLSKQKDIVDDVAEDYCKRFMDFQNKRSIFERELDEKKNEMSVIKDDVTKYGWDLSEIDRKIQEIKLEIENNVYSYYNDKIREISIEAANLKSLISVFNNYRNSLERLSNSYKLWLTKFKDIKVLVAVDCIRFLNARLLSILDMFGMNDWSFEIRTFKETISGNPKSMVSVAVKPPGYKESVPFESLSGGESQRLRLAFSVAMGDMVRDFYGWNSSFEIFDEPTSWLSQDGIDDLMYLLKDRAHSNRMQTWVIDHRSLEHPFDGVVEVVKDDQSSRLIISDVGGG